MVERDAFCNRLKRARETAGLTLETISETSKIQVSLLAGLERGDVSRWPTGIFRRAFIREYAAAVGLPTEQVVHEFARLFPDSGAPTLQGPSFLSEGLDGLRLTLAPDTWWRRAATRTHGLAAVLDLVFVAIVGFIASRVGLGSYWAVTGIVALVYYPLSMACAGRTLAVFWLISRPHGRWRAIARPAQPLVIERPRLVFRRPTGSDAPQEFRDDAEASTQSLRAVQ